MTITAEVIISEMERVWNEMKALAPPPKKHVFVLPMLPMEVALVKLMQKDWHRRTCYAERVRKKWRKRYGCELIHCFETTDGIFLSAVAFYEYKAKQK